MLVTKEITKENELLIYVRRKLVYKKWLDTGESKIFDLMAYDKYTHLSILDLDVKDSPYLIYVQAKIRLKKPDEGGRKGGIKSGFRPDHVFEYKKDNLLVVYIGDIQFDKPEILELGKFYKVIVRFPLVQKIENYMDKGRKWFLHEGGKKIGEAEIIDFDLPNIK